jgi:hypothetical protein
MRWWRRPLVPAPGEATGRAPGGEPAVDQDDDGSIGVPGPDTGWIEHNVERVIARLGEHTDFPFGLDRRSLIWAEGFLERQRAQPGFDAATLVPVLGSFLGQCLVVHGDFVWVERPEGWCVHCPRIDAFPFAKVAKQARHGVAGGESMVRFFDLVLETSRTPFPADGAGP